MRYQLLITIVDRGKGSIVAEILQQENVAAQWVALGHGTAHPDLLGLLGLRDTEKDVVLSVLMHPVARLGQALMLDWPGAGIAMTIPLDSIGGAQTLEYLTGGESTAPLQEGSTPVNEYNPAYELVVAIVNRGYSETVMEAARPAGARGGTVVHARSESAEQASHFLGITIQPEKEMVLILCTKETKIPIMQAITRNAGLSSEGHGIVFSLPVSDVMGVSRLTQELAEK